MMQRHTHTATDRVTLSLTRSCGCHDNHHASLHPKVMPPFADTLRHATFASLLLPSLAPPSRRPPTMP